MLSLCLVAWSRIVNHGTPGDDAFMTFRSAKNIMNGYGFVYNPGELVYSSTTALYTLLLAAVGKITSLMPHETYFEINLLFDLLNVFIFGILCFRIIPNIYAAIFAIFCFSLSWHSLTASILGMETPLFTFFIVLTTYSLLYIDNSAWRLLGSITAGLAAITRPEGLVLLFAYLFFISFKKKKFPVHEITFSTLTIMPWIIFALLHFGTIIPHSIKAKRLGYIFEPILQQSTLITHFQELFFSIKLSENNHLLLTATCLFVLFSLSILGLLKGCKESNYVVFALSFFTLATASAYFVFNPFPFWWYYAPFEPGYIILVYLGLSAILQHQSRITKYFSYCTMLILLITQLLQFHIPLATSSIEKVDSMPFLSIERDLGIETYYTIKALPKASLREDEYISIAQKYDPQMSESTTVLSPEFGAFGYYSKAKIISSIGHVNPEVIPLLPKVTGDLSEASFNNFIPLQMVKTLSPDYILSPEIFIWNSLLPQNWFHENYSLLETRPCGIWGFGNVLFFKRKSKN